MTLPSANLRRAAGQTLLVDADDTLWENNVYFERAIAAFISYLDHRVHTAVEVRGHLNAVEQATVSARGYGVESFRHSLTVCFEQLTDVPLTEDKRNRIHSFAQSIADQKIELLAGVTDTLTELSGRHRILLVTKGNTSEQTSKLQRSGLAKFFSGVEVLREKHADAYRSLATLHCCDAATTWMIGNSPRSDINPALAAGLHAVFIPHGLTWVLEDETVGPPPAGQTLIELANFAELTANF